jgi:branched-subunit amino acid ABC-type transport system permease component
MKTICTAVGGVAGLLYSGAAVITVYSKAPLELQAFIVAGVAAVGASAGYILGFVASLNSQGVDKRTPTDAAPDRGRSG